MQAKPMPERHSPDSQLKHRLREGVQLSSLLSEFPQAQLIPELYEGWRQGTLNVLRTWGHAEPTQAFYRTEECLLPSDHLTLQDAPSPPERLTVVTWNVNSIRSRFPLLEAFLREHAPDILCLQETKTTDDRFPYRELEALGYRSVHYGQKTYNGVAILTRHPLQEEAAGFHNGWDPENARLIMASIAGLRIVNVYVPQGSQVGSDKFHYKLEFLDQLREELKRQLHEHSNVVVVGDLNIAPDARDVVSAEDMKDQVSFHPQEHQRFERLLALGLIDLFRAVEPGIALYSWWDFRTRGFERGEGMRIDHILGSPSVSTRVERCWIDLENRAQPKPSDHAPVLCTLKPSC